EVLIKIEATIVRQEFTHRDIPPPHRWIPQTGHEQHMGRHASREEPAGDLIVERLRIVQRLEIAQNPVPGMLTTLMDPLAFGIVFGYGSLECGQLAGWICDDARHPETASHMVIAQNQLR